MVEPPRTYGWRSGTILAIAFIAFAAGFGSFGAIAALGNVAKTFGHVAQHANVAELGGLSGSVLGIGLAVLRGASLLAMPLAILADRAGRRRTMLGYCALGLCCTVVAAVSPSYWWFVAIFAVGRPLYTAASSIAQVAAAELTSTATRAAALALVIAGTGLGSGAAGLLHTTLSQPGGFRLEFALAIVPLVGVALVARVVVEPPRWVAADHHAHAVLGRVEQAQVRRLVIVVGLTFAASFASGPATGFLFVYADNVVKLGQGLEASMIAVAGVTGFVGLLIGRWGADRLGRRPMIAGSVVAVLCFAVLAYSGTKVALVLGYAALVAAAGALAPAGTAFANELFPTKVRAAVAGWNIAAGVIGGMAGSLAFGFLVDWSGSFAVAAACTFLPPGLVLLALRHLPETAGREPEELWAA